MNQDQDYAIPGRLLIGIITYLQNRPYCEVAGALRDLEGILRPQIEKIAEGGKVKE